MQLERHTWVSSNWNVPGRHIGHELVLVDFVLTIGI